MLAGRSSWLSRIGAVIRYFFRFKISFGELKLLASKAAFKGDRACYERLIRYYDGGFRFLEGAVFERFVGFDGRGANTLDSFCLMRSEGTLYFEKIYLSDSVDWQKLIFFMCHHVQFLGDDKLVVPRPLLFFGGHTLKGCFSEYVHVREVTPSECFELSIVCIGELTRLSLSSAAPDVLSDVMKHDGFKRCYRKSIDFLQCVGGDVAVFCKAFDSVLSLPRFVAHGDLSVSNMSAPNVIFDWDNFGYYPPGFDLALVLVKLGLLYSEGSLDKLSRKYYPLYSSRVSLEEFRLAFSFFCMVFIGNRDVGFKKKLFSNLKASLMAVELASVSLTQVSV